MITSPSNQFETSHVYDWLNDYYYDHLDEKLKDSLQMTSYCTDATDDENAARETCTNVGSAKVALLSLDEYNLAIPKQMECMDVIEFACLDNEGNVDECVAPMIPTGKTCLEVMEEEGLVVDHESGMVDVSGTFVNDINWSYLAWEFPIGYPFSYSYTLTPAIESTHGWIFLCGPTNPIPNDVVNNSNLIFGVRPVITVSPDVVLGDGDGTYENPYREIENHENEKLYDVVTSGEYVQFNDHLYRVVEKNASGTKLSYDGSMLPSEYVEADRGVIYDETLELLQNGEVLNELVDVNNQAKIVDFTWNTGQPLTYSSHYSLALEDGSTSFVSKTGALKVGEMYSIPTNFIMSFANGFPENWLFHYWFFTTNNDSNAWVVDIDGVMSGFTSKSSRYAIRPAFVIDKEVTVISGEGTIESPYVI